MQGREKKCKNNSCFFVWRVYLEAKRYVTARKDETVII